jgi:hypothetical protein
MLFPQQLSAVKATNLRGFAGAIMIGYEHAINTAFEIAVQLQRI